MSEEKTSAEHADDAAEMRRQRDELGEAIERCHRMLDRHYGESEETTSVETLEDRLEILLGEIKGGVDAEREACAVIADKQAGIRRTIGDTKAIARAIRERKT